MRAQPKSDADRVRRNAPTFSTDSAEWDGILRGPALPRDRVWCKQTRDWWKKWRSSPQSMIMVDTDWEQMLITALIHDRLYSSTNLSHTAFVNLASELRRREDAVGGSYEARKSLHLNVETPSSKNAADLEDPVAAVAAVDYKSRLGVNK